MHNDGIWRVQSSGQFLTRVRAAILTHVTALSGADKGCSEVAAIWRGQPQGFAGSKRQIFALPQTHSGQLAEAMQILHIDIIGEAGFFAKIDKIEKNLPARARFVRKQLSGSTSTSRPGGILACVSCARLSPL